MMSNAIARSKNRGRLLVATYVGAIFLWTLALSVSPQLHERFHSDANQAQHECSVTLIAAGNYDHVAPAPVFVRPNLATQISSVATLRPLWVASPFLSASIFEHAPPAYS
jgi:hypothetical protein